MSDTSRQAVIVAAARTPIGKFLGGLSPLAAPELGAIAIRAAIERSKIDLQAIEEVIMGNVIQGGVGQAPARQAAMKAGVPATVSALTINKVCGSGLKAVMLADQGIRVGDIKTGWVKAFIPDEVDTPVGNGVAGTEFLGVDPDGNIYSGGAGIKGMVVHNPFRPVD